MRFGAHPVCHTVFHHFPQEIIHSPKTKFGRGPFQFMVNIYFNFHEN